MALPIKQGILPNELLSSWITRVAGENSMMVAGLLAHVGFGNQIQTDFDLHASDELLHALSVTGLPSEGPKRLHRAKISEWGEKTGSLYQCMRRWILPAGHRHTKVRFCPLCLSERAYYRKAWRLHWYAACHHHKIVLSDRCHTCSSPQVLYRTSWRHGVGCCANCSESLSNDASETEFDDLDYWHTVALSLNRLRACTPQQDASRWFQAVWMLMKWLEKLRCDGKTVNLFLSEPLERMRKLFPEAVSFHQARILWDEEPFQLKQLISEYQFEFDRVTYHQCPRPLKVYRRAKDWRVPTIDQLEKAIFELKGNGEDITYLRVAEVAGCSYETIRKYDHLDQFVKARVGKSSLIRLRS